jgi:hypothetical protein
MKIARNMLFWGLFVLAGGLLFAQGFTVSALLDSSLSMSAGAGDSPAFLMGLEEYANLRMQAKLKEKAAFYGAVNFIAASGSPAKNAEKLGLYQFQTRPGVAPSAFTAGENYVAGFELERLYFRLNGEIFDFDGGLLRLPFGYGQVWGSSDFLNPKNPLAPDARPRAVLGADLSWYPADEFKILTFGAGPKDPFTSSGEGGLVGVSMDKHWERLSLQMLYAFETPKENSSRGIHRIGASVKADLELGFVIDMLYTYNAEAETVIDGLSYSMGFDYSFLDGKFVVLVEYLYNGASSSTAFDAKENIFGRNKENYLYSGFTWIINDYANTGVALISGLSDISFMPVLTAQYDLFQGCSLICSAQIPLDRALFAGNDQYGELGPEKTQSYFNFNAKVRLRF